MRKSIIGLLVTPLLLALPAVPASAKLQGEIVPADSQLVPARNHARTYGGVFQEDVCPTEYR